MLLWLQLALGRKEDKDLNSMHVALPTGWCSPEAEFISVWGTAGLAGAGTFSCESMAFRGSCHVVVWSLWLRQSRVEVRPSPLRKSLIQRMADSSLDSGYCAFSPCTSHWITCIPPPPFKKKVISIYLVCCVSTLSLTYSCNLLTIPLNKCMLSSPLPLQILGEACKAHIPHSWTPVLLWLDFRWHPQSQFSLWHLPRHWGLPLAGQGSIFHKSTFRHF